MEKPKRQQGVQPTRGRIIECRGAGGTNWKYAELDDRQPVGRSVFSVGTPVLLGLGCLRPGLKLQRSPFNVGSRQRSNVDGTRRRR